MRGCDCRNDELSFLDPRADFTQDLAFSFFVLAAADDDERAGTAALDRRQHRRLRIRELRPTRPRMQLVAVHAVAALPSGVSPPGHAMSPVCSILRGTPVALRHARRASRRVRAPRPTQV